jgi:hypothetical protein
MQIKSREGDKLSFPFWAEKNKKLQTVAASHMLPQPDYFHLWSPCFGLGGSILTNVQTKFKLGWFYTGRLQESTSVVVYNEV